ncbi:hypothetical protein [Methylobrevis pamukkalensis]|uniref:Lipoprotein n=1 Tax=Methylobrevis pamukkalensis TaxID=1439726 RepID=A0A1E3H1K1_9HYPH|nr:hypothetical protein [Methylobrevis pamukkalensis]ODN70187.1 hypothetical protein A6302_02461 [Methylobrevis pamukkalensis]
MKKGLAAVVVGAIALGGCVTTEVTRFQPGQGQESIYRQGLPAVVSMKPGSTMIIAPVTRNQAPGLRPSYVAAIYNSSGQPVTFEYTGITVHQRGPDGGMRPVRVYNVDDLQREARNQAIMGAILVGAAAAGGAAIAANNAGHYSGTGTIYGRHGARTFTYSGWDQGRANAAAAGVAAAGGVAVGAIAVQGQQAVAALESQMLQTNTIMPGEWYGGQFQFARDAKEGPRIPHSDPRQYRIDFAVGPTTHVFDLTTERVKQE